jgi:hypothetical protein
MLNKKRLLHSAYLTLKVTSELIVFSVKITIFQKFSISVLTSFLMRAQPVFLLNMSKKTRQSIAGNLFFFASLD